MEFDFHSQGNSFLVTFKAGWFLYHAENVWKVENYVSVLNNAGSWCEMVKQQPAPVIQEDWKLISPRLGLARPAMS